MEVLRVNSSYSPSHPPDYSSGLDGVNEGTNTLFVWLLVLFLAVCAVTIIASRLWKATDDHIRLVSFMGPAGDLKGHHEFWSRNRTSSWPWIKRHLLLAPFWSRRHNREIQISKAYSVGTLPTRLQSLVILAYMLLNCAGCMVLDYSQQRTAIVAELRGRTGALAAFNFVPTVLFATRNNPLIPLLGISFDTFNIAHRNLARLSIVESVVHVICWAANTAPSSGTDGLGQAMRDRISFRWGMVAIAAFPLIALLAWSPVRHAFYETFVNVHRLLVLTSLICTYEHLATDKLPQAPYLVLAMVLWAIELLVRLMRLVIYNWSSRCRTQVVVEALPFDACRLNLSLVRHWNYSPGTHVHVYIPSVGLWSSHPFSVAWADQVKAEAQDVSVETGLDMKQRGSISISCIVRAQQGMTRQLYNKASAAPGATITFFGAAEGPYGGHESLDSYGTVLLFAGGIGITHQLGFVRRLVENYQDGTCATRKVHLVWSITDTDCLEWVRPYMDYILKIEGRRDVLRVDLHITRGTANISSKTGTVMMHKGRCNIKETVDRVFLDRVGAMAVTVCGPGSFSDDCRQAVRRRVELGCIDFVEEAFTF